MQSEIKNQSGNKNYMEFSLDELKVELFKRKLPYRKVAKRIRYKSPATIGFMLNDTDDLSPKAKEKCRKKVCNLLARLDRNSIQKN